MANPWFRMYSDFLNDPKMISLAFEDQRHFIGILALKSDGTIEQNCDEKMLDRMVAQRLWVDYAIITDVKKRLVNAGLIDVSWQPIAWNKRQFKSDKDSTAAARQQRFRESQKDNALRNVTVTRLETETDSNTDSDSDSYTDAESHTSQNSVCDFTPTPVGICCKAIIDQGIKTTNQHNPTFLALVEAGATEHEFAEAARIAVSRGSGNFNYVLGIVKKQREDAAKLVLHKGRLPNKQEVLEQSNRAATEGWVPPELRRA